MLRARQIQELKSIFIIATNAPRDSDAWFDDRKLHNSVGNALIIVGKEKIFELADEVYPYLNDTFSEFRAEAVRTLGWNTRLGINEFCEKQAFKIWEQDPDEEVKIAALAAWGQYYTESKNANVLKELYEILMSKESSSQIRTWALRLLLKVSGSLIRAKDNFYILDLIEIEEREEFDRAVDWERINRILKEYVPGWKEKK